MCGCSMALRYDDRGSNFSKPYYNGKSGGGNGGGKDRSWNNTGDGGRYGNDCRETTSSSADHYSRKHERRETTSASRNQENWDDRSNAGDSDKAQLRQVGDWTEQLSSAGKKYYYNCRTEVSQWEKPAEWIAFEKRSGHDQARKKRPERSTVDDQISPSHSSAGRPSSSRDQIQNQQRRPGGLEDGGAVDNASGRNYGNQSRRPHPNNIGGPNRSNDFSRGSRSKYDARAGHVSSNRPHHDGQQSRYDQHAYASGSGVDRGSVDYRDRSKRPLQSAPSASREVESEDNSIRERSPKRSRISPSEHGNVDKNAQDKRIREQPSSSAAAMDCDGDDVASNVQIDMDRLPHLLVEIAEKNNIDLSDPDALEKIKRHLKTALCNELNTNVPPAKNGETCHFAAVSDDEEEPSTKAEEPQLASGGEDRRSVVHEEVQAQPVDSAGAVTKSSLAEFFNEELVAHVRGWSAEHFEVQAEHLANTSFHISLNVSHISADLKCARSLVRTAEIRSTLLEQRIAYLRQQYHELETMSKPSALTVSALGSS